MTEVEGTNRLSTGKEKNPDWPEDGEGKSVVGTGSGGGDQPMPFRYYSLCDVV